jgi:soluble lytic murein transglycosylase-like protein
MRCLTLSRICARWFTLLLLALTTPVVCLAASVDPALAAQWREQARALEHGEGVARNVEEAVALYCKAALAHDAQAHYSLGWIYANGRGVPRNDAFAAYLFKQAAELGDQPAVRMLAMVGTTSAKPPCVLEAEAAELQRLELEAARARAAAAAAAAEAEHTRQAKKYELMIDTPGQKHIMGIVQRLAPEFGIHPGLAFAVIRAESNFDPNAISVKNAQGLMQLIPDTAARFGVKKILDPEQNIRGGLAYLRWLLAYFKGNVGLVAAAYNAGEGTVDRYRGVPPFKETQHYIMRIQEAFGLAQHPFDPRVTPPSPELPRIQFASKP